MPLEQSNSHVRNTKALTLGISTTKRSHSRPSMIFCGLLLSGLKGRKAESVRALGRMSVRDSKRCMRSKMSASEAPTAGLSGYAAILALSIKCSPSRGHAAALTSSLPSMAVTSLSQTRLSVSTRLSDAGKISLASASSTSSKLSRKGQCK